MAQTPDTIDEQIHQAQRDADEARARARTLEAQQAAEAEAGRAEAEKARLAFEKKRQHELPDFRRRVRRAREAFFEAVATSGDVHATWFEFQRQIRIAAAEERRTVAYLDQAAVRRYEALQRTWRSYRERLDYLRNTQPPTPTPTYVSPRRSQEAPPAPVDPRLVELNAEINAWAESEGLKYRRDEADLSEPRRHEVIGDRPRSGRPMTLGELGKWGEQDFASTYDAAVELALKHTGSEHNRQVVATLRQDHAED